eukprot:8312834-Pyramimonas_sp.AAC.1
MLSKITHELHPIAYADICTLVHYDNDVNTGFHYYEAEGIALHMHYMIGSAHSRIIQCLKSTKPQAGFDQDMTRFEEVADAPTPDEIATEASEAEPPHEDGRLPTKYAESAVDLESHVMEVRYAELQDARELRGRLH